MKNIKNRPKKISFRTFSNEKPKNSAKKDVFRCLAVDFVSAPLTGLLFENTQRILWTSMYGNE